MGAQRFLVEVMNPEVTTGKELFPDTTKVSRGDYKNLFATWHAALKQEMLVAKDNVAVLKAKYAVNPTPSVPGVVRRVHWALRTPQPQTVLPMEPNVV